MAFLYLTNPLHMFIWLHQWLLVFFIALFAPAAHSTFSKPHAHPFYVGVVEVNHNKSAASLEISCKLFAEDAEAVLEQQYKTTLDLSQPQQKSKIDGLLADYVPKHLALQADKKGVKLRYVGFEKEAESLYCYFEATGIPTVSTIDLRNSMLYDFTDKQINIMHVMVNGVRKSYKLDYPKTEASFAF
jgi:hypothetical protein